MGCSGTFQMHFERYEDMQASELEAMGFTRIDARIN